jgi:uncharacterized protein
MTELFLPATLTAAAAMAVLNLWLGIRIMRLRLATRIAVGDGGDPRIAARMRAQLNFAEYTPVVLILILAIELSGGAREILWLVTALYAAARIAHGVGMDLPSPNALRSVGVLTTVLVTLGLAGWAAAIVFLA